MSITDPLQLERRLKRQRSTDGAPDQQSSSEEVGEGRIPKRSRLTSDEDENDPLDVAGLLSPQQSNNVRFADETQLVVQTFINSDTNDTNPFSRKAGGFDPALLNPLPSPQDVSSSYSSLANGDIPLSSTASTTSILPITPQINSPNPFLSPHPIDPLQLSAEGSHSEYQQSVPVAEPSLAQPQVAENSNQPSPVPPQAMEIERTPTPLPDFYVDETELSGLKEVLCTRTNPLNVEELEQLRATCLGAVWRHRTEWNREKLIRELLNITNEFVEEVCVDNVTMSP